MPKRSRSRSRDRSGGDGVPVPAPTDVLLTEGGDRIVQEDGSPILV